jgi:hypothetical protein
MLTLDQWQYFWRRLASAMKTGPLCSSCLHKGPGLTVVARMFFKGKLPPIHVAKARQTQREPDAMRFSSNSYFFFFLAGVPNHRFNRTTPAAASLV